MPLSISADPDHLAGKVPEKTDQKTRNNLDMPYINTMSRKCQTTKKSKFSDHRNISKIISYNIH